MKIAFFDVDGTLVSFNTHCIPESAISALDKLRCEGVEIVIATGRAASRIPHISMIPYSAIIGLNGSECVMRDGTVVKRHFISQELLKKAIELGDNYDFAIAAKVEEGFVVDKITPRVLEMSDKIGASLPKVVNLSCLNSSEQIGQLCFFTDIETEKKIMSSLPGLSASRWCDIFADINITGIDKGTAIQEYAEFRGVDMKDTIAFGDGENDIPMILKAGIGVAMGNASLRVKELADFTTNEIDRDGIAKALRHFGLI